jgi:hypothetical protein
VLAGGGYIAVMKQWKQSRITDNSRPRCGQRPRTCCSQFSCVGCSFHQFRLDPMNFGRAEMQVSSVVASGLNLVSCRDVQGCLLRSRSRGGCQQRYLGSSAVVWLVERGHFQAPSLLLPLFTGVMARFSLVRIVRHQ